MVFHVLLSDDMILKMAFDTWKMYNVSEAVKLRLIAKMGAVIVLLWFLIWFPLFERRTSEGIFGHNYDHPTVKRYPVGLITEGLSYNS